MSARFIPVVIDKPRFLTFTHRALFRMGTLPAPFEFEDISRPRKSYAALIAWLWACLAPQDAADFPTPEDLAAHIPPDKDRCAKLAGLLADAINAGAEAKNDQSSTPATSPSSSSA